MRILVTLVHKIPGPGIPVTVLKGCSVTVAMADSASSLYEGDNVLLYSPEKEGFLYAEPSR